MKNFKNCQLFIISAIIIIVLIVGCKKEDVIDEVIIEGYYEGYFAYAGDTIWEAIYFKSDTFVEVPSGGLPMELQKWPCIVEGLYSIIDSNISFNVYKYPPPEVQCDTTIYLSGDFMIKPIQEEIVFWKEEGDLRQTYKLKLRTASR